MSRSRVLRQRGERGQLQIVVGHVAIADDGPVVPAQRQGGVSTPVADRIHRGDGGRRAGPVGADGDLQGLGGSILIADDGDSAVSSVREVE